MATKEEESEQIMEIEKPDDFDNSTIQKSKWYHVNKETIPSKIAYYLVGSMGGAYTPFINPFLVDVGLSPSQAGLITGLRLIGAILGSVLFGMITDYTQKYQVVLSLVSFCAIGVLVPLPWLPKLVGQQNTTCMNFSMNATTTEISSCAKMDGYDTLFIAFLCAYLVFAFFDGYILPYADMVAMSQVTNSKKKINIGMQRVFIPIGFGIATLIASGLFKSVPKDMNISKYSVQHFLYPPLVICLVIISYPLLKRARPKRKETSGGGNLIKTLRISLLRPIVAFFMITVFIQGFLVGTQASFLFVLMKTFFPPDILFGITMILASVSGLICYPFAIKIVKRLGGPFPTMGMSLFVNAIRFAAYGYTPSVYLVTALQIFTHGLVISLFNVAKILKTQEISTEENRSTMFGVTNAIYLGVAGITANIVGGLTIEHYGVKVLFRCEAVVSLIWSILIFIHMLYDRKVSKKRKGEIKTNEEKSILS